MGQRQALGQMFGMLFRDGCEFTLHDAGTQIKVNYTKAQVKLRRLRDAGELTTQALYFAAIARGAARVLRSRCRASPSWEGPGQA